MKNKIILIALTFILIICLKNVIIAQITRGALPGELYISTDWYMENYSQLHYAIFHSTNNGEHIELKYENIESPPNGEMQIGTVIGDATPGALYNKGNNELWVSFDYGESWEYKETYGSSGRFASGCINGEIYKCCVNVVGTIWRSEDYGNAFIEVTDDAKYILDVGNSPGDIFGFDGSAGLGFNLHFSNDYGENFTEIPIDSTVAFWEPGGYYPQISRGTEPEELFLVSWWLNSNYKIFHSADTGNTWTEKFESEYIEIYTWRVNYTAGRVPGSFYVMRSRINPAGDHIWLYIDYSSDYGETFITYFHDLDSLYTSIPIIKKTNIKFTCFPNPFSSKTTIEFFLPEDCKNPVLNIYNVNSSLVRKYNIANKNSIDWDGTDNNGIKVPRGIYLYNIEYAGFFSETNKLLIIN